ncbi:hypothetical protein PSTT_13314, partial [Puccinia striiformis]
DSVRCNSNKSEDRHVLVNFSANGASEELKQALSLDSLFGLKGLVAVVTGGGTGLYHGRREEVLKQAVDNYHKHAKGEIIGLQADVTNKADLERIIGKISEKEPNGIQILVNNAGISGPKMEAFSNGHTIHAISGMVNISQNHFAYNASKAAAIHLTKMMACELANSQIRFNSIAPGVFPSAMTAKKGSDDRGKSDISESFDASKYKIPAGRPGRLQEMAASILYLCGKGCQYCDGLVMNVDGGILLTNPSAC